MTRLGLISRILSLVLIVMLALPYPVAFAAEGAPMNTKFIHEPPDNFIPGFRIILDTSISDSAGVKEARCYFKTKDMEEFIFVEMQKNMEIFEAVIPAPGLGVQSLSYFFLTLNGNRQAARTRVYEMPEKDTAEAKDLRDAELAKAKGDKIDLDSLKDRLMDRLEKEYKSSLKKSQIAKKEGIIRAGTDMAKAPEKAAGFSDRVEITAAQPDARYSLLQAETSPGAAGAVAAAGGATAVAAKSATATATGAAATGGASTLGWVIGGLAVVAGGAAVAGGGGGGGGSTAPAGINLSGTWCVTVTRLNDPPDKLTIVLTNTAPNTYSWSGLTPQGEPVSAVFTVSGTSLTIQTQEQDIQCGKITGYQTGTTDGNTFSVSGSFTEEITTPPCFGSTPTPITSSGVRGPC